MDPSCSLIYNGITCNQLCIVQTGAEVDTKHVIRNIMCCKAVEMSVAAMKWRQQTLVVDGLAIKVGGEIFQGGGHHAPIARDSTTHHLSLHLEMAVLVNIQFAIHFSDVPPFSLRYNIHAWHKKQNRVAASGIYHIPHI